MNAGRVRLRRAIQESFEVALEKHSPSELVHMLRSGEAWYDPDKHTFSTGSKDDPTEIGRVVAFNHDRNDTIWEEPQGDLDAKWFVVNCCGCTDCFPHAAFVDKGKAEKWAKDNCKNPEGFVIEEMTQRELAEISHR
jgi:hypothetical protein